MPISVLQAILERGRKTLCLPCYMYCYIYCPIKPPGELNSRLCGYSFPCSHLLSYSASSTPYDKGNLTSTLAGPGGIIKRLSVANPQTGGWWLLTLAFELPFVIPAPIPNISPRICFAVTSSCRERSGRSAGVKGTGDD